MSSQFCIHTRSFTRAFMHFFFTHAPTHFDVFVDDDNDDADEDGNRSFAVVGVGENGYRGKQVVETYVGFTYIL